MDSRRSLALIQLRSPSIVGGVVFAICDCRFLGGAPWLSLSRRRVFPTVAAAEKMRRLQVKSISAMAVPVALRKGQRWTMAEQQLRIYRVGVHLVEFRVFKSQ